MRFPDDVFEQVIEAKAADDRSTNGEIVHLVRQGLASRSATPTDTGEVRS